MARQTTRGRSAGRSTAATAARNGTILAWEDDPGEPTQGRHPISRPVPNLSTRPLPISIKGRTPQPREQQLGSAGFRYWAAADALRRAADFWGSVLPANTKWHRTNGTRLPVALDDGVDLNAYYDRHGLHFFHDTMDGRTFYSGESPDVACHEFGHAVLDAIRPQLWDAMAGEVAAFHEGFADISAMLSALQLRSLREKVLAETQSRIDRSSSLSRLAEQLGWAIRQGHPDVVDRDCLRNASNSFFYADPTLLPPSSPASQLSSEPHNFSRVFSGAFLQVLAGMFAAQPTQDQASLKAASIDAGRILISGIQASPVVPSYYSQVAAHMLDVDLAQFGGRYRDALKSGFVRQGVLSLQAATTPPPPEDQPGARRALTAIAPGAEDQPLARIALPASHLGLREDLLVTAASHPKRFAVVGAAPDTGAIESHGHDEAAASFLEDLARRGRIDFAEHAVPGATVVAKRARKTHVVVRDRGELVLLRRYFDCGFDCGAC
jgi:hypothetical protein